MLKSYQCRDRDKVNMLVSNIKSNSTYEELNARMVLTTILIK